MRYFIILFVCLISLSTFAQTGIGTTTPNASAKLEIAATDKGFLPPRIALTATNAFSPIVGTSSSATGLLIYNTSTAGTAPNNVVPGYYYWNGSLWIAISNGLIIDNTKTTSPTSFTLASTDNNKIFLITTSSALTITVPNSLPVGFSCQIIQGGTGQIIFAQGSGVTLSSANGLSTRATNSVIGLLMNTTTTGFVFGDSIF
jgi:hypothetical protein